MKRLLIFLLLLMVFTAQSLFAQRVRPLGITIDTKANFDNAEWRWTPVIGFTLEGPVNRGSQATVDFTLPSGMPFVTVKCDTPMIEENNVSRIGGCGFSNPDAAKAINQEGVFGFQIKLDGKVYYSGKFKVGRILYNPDGTPAKNKQFYYYVDNDWRLNFAYVGPYFDGVTSKLYTEFWVKNRIKNRAEIFGYLYHNGKQVAETMIGGVLKAEPKENPKQEYTQIQLVFPAVYPKPEDGGMGGFFNTYQNPGEYEVKLMRDGKLARSIKFTIGQDGILVPTGIGAGIVKVGVIVPNQVIGETDGVFNKLAWKEGVWGNPISNLIVP